MITDTRIFVAGHKGLVGSALCRQLEASDANQLLTADRESLDLCDYSQVMEWFAAYRPTQVYLAAAKVGGIHANDSSPADFIAQNLKIQTNVIEAAYTVKCQKLLFLGSSCIYPKHAPQPMPESCLLEGGLEPTNEWYAIAKIAGIKLCQAYRRQYGFDAISVMPTNLYGPGDNFDLKTSHVLPALIRRFHEARASSQASVTLWGSGRPRREFLHVDDLANACVFLMDTYSDERIINVGWGQDISIFELAQMIREIVGYDGRIEFDPGMPDGTPRKLLDVTRLTGAGWRPRISLRAGLQQTYEWYQANETRVRGKPGLRVG